MVSITLANGESREHEKVGIEGGLVMAYEITEVEGGWDEEDVVEVYPESSVIAIELADEESLGEVSSNSPPPEKYVVETVE